MNSSKKLLVTFDGSNAARAVFEHAASVAKAMDASLLLLQVHTLPTQIWAIPDGEERARERQKYLEESSAQLSGVADELHSLTGVEVEPVLRSLDQTWSLVDTILAAADESDAAMICMATQGQGSQLHLIIGSTTIGVLAKSKRPLLLIRSDRE